MQLRACVLAVDTLPDDDRVTNATRAKDPVPPRASRWARAASYVPPVDHDPLTALLRGVADGQHPPADGGVTVLPLTGRLAAVLAFTGHHVVVADVEPAWVAERLPVGDYGAPVSAPFLDELGRRLGRTYDNLDHVLVAPPLAGPPPIPLVAEDPLHPHPRADRARHYREDLRVWTTPDGEGLLLLGRGLGGRVEASFEVRAEGRRRGLGRALAASARHLAGEAVWLQVAPGNAASLRAVLGAGGFVPVGAELLYPPAREPAAP